MADEENGMRLRLVACFYCENEQQPGYIQTEKNGPIGECPICGGTGKLPVLDSTAALSLIKDA